MVPSRVMRSTHRRAAILLATLAALAASLASGGCGTDPTPGPTFTQAELMDPEKCASCHPDHYREWSGSMHAYAAEDPLFLAMNARAQRETGGAIGSFCIKCHAPVALATGATTDGTNIADVPRSLRGVTCYFCHSAERVTDTHDAPIDLAKDGVLRGGIPDPASNEAHASAYSPLQDRGDPASSTLCGSCHDIVTPHGVHLERTFAEWKETIFATPSLGLTCGQCHMDQRAGRAADVPSAPSRSVHAHTFPGVDVALTPVPEKDAQRAAVERSLDSVLQAALCVKGSGSATIQVVLDNVGAGHSFPSGATQDRRAWVELVAYAGGAPVYQSGVVPEGSHPLALSDPDLWLLRDCLHDENNNEVHMFWEAMSYDSNQLPGPVTNVQSDPRYYLTHAMRTFPRPTSTPPTIATMPDRVTMRVRMMPVGLDVIDDLIASGDLDPSVRAEMPTFSLGGADLEWTAEIATIKYLDQGQPVLCVTKGLTTGANASTPAPEHTTCAP